MRSPSAYYLLLLYITVIIKPLTPFIVDAWDHQFNEIEHVSIIHVKYGSHHLEKELANSTADNKSKDQNTLKTEDLFTAHVITQPYSYRSIKNNSGNQRFHALADRLPSVYLSTQVQPPRFS